MMKSKTYTPMPSRVIGIDPGFDRCGVAILEKLANKETLLYSTCINTSRQDSHEIRLNMIGTSLRKVLEEWQPESMAIEKLFFNINQKTAIKVAEARGVIMHEASLKGLPVTEYSPQAIKIAVTGYGKATKPQVEAMVTRILGLDKRKMLDDEMDAIAVCITHLASTRAR